MPEPRHSLGERRVGLHHLIGPPLHQHTVVVVGPETGWCRERVGARRGEHDLDGRLGARIDKGLDALTRWRKRQASKNMSDRGVTVVVGSRSGWRGFLGR